MVKYCGCASLSLSAATIFFCHPIQLIKMASISKRMVVVGDAGCGKTSLLIAYSTDKPVEGNKPRILEKENVDVMVNKDSVSLTLGSTAGEKSGRLAMFHDGMHILIHACIIAGYEHFDFLRKLAYQNTDAFIMCFSIGSPDSLRNIKKKWMPEVRRICPTGTTLCQMILCVPTVSCLFSFVLVPMLLVGNKKDLRNDIDARFHLAESNLGKINSRDGVAMAQKIGAYAYVECSANQNDGVKEVFQKALESIYYSNEHCAGRSKK